MSLTVALTKEEIQRLQYCSICGIDKGFFVCQSVKCPNKDKLLYCSKCGKDIHNHGSVKIQTVQQNKVIEWQAIQ